MRRCGQDAAAGATSPAVRRSGGKTVHALFTPPASGAVTYEWPAPPPWKRIQCSGGLDSGGVPRTIPAGPGCAGGRARERPPRARRAPRAGAVKAPPPGRAYAAGVSGVSGVSVKVSPFSAFSTSSAGGANRSP